ncbi:DNA-directed RNA polymeras-like protein III subunit RPC9 [Amylocarpus encephaloides]|uniref:DNA-directed RNA polymerase III subunit RPC9 n=1 Tax=Amylocarpus encephaloides TaxID=45428 RepID=A0A9P7YD00_9HELO|nr:DNA-directed RNA polymeras-like protein III subunit RPC9 [Amylocarpus encephaloides]
MKILEAQSAALTNYEVYTHLVQQDERYERRKTERLERLKKEKKGKGKAIKQEHADRRPGNLATMSIELLNYLREAPSPLGCKPLPYDEKTIKRLLEGLRPWDFTKGEIIMILNLRPTKPENLNTIVEEMEERFPGDEDQLAILSVIEAVLGRPDGDAETKAMKANANKAREAEQGDEEDVEITTEQKMDVDG